MEIKNLPELDFTLILARTNREKETFLQWKNFFNAISTIFSNTAISLSLLQNSYTTPLIQPTNAQIAFHNIKSELKELQNELNNSKQIINEENITQIDYFLQHYEAHQAAVNASGKSLLTSINEINSQAEQLKQNYWSAEQALENAMIERKSKEIISELTKTLNSSKQAYKTYIETANAKIKEKHIIYESLINAIFDIEEQKIGLLKVILQKQVKLMEHLGRVLIDKATAMASITSFINYESEFELLQNDCKFISTEGKKAVFLPLEFCIYKSQKNTENIQAQPVIEKYFSSTDNMSEETINKFLIKTIQSIKNSDPMSLEEKAHVVELLHHKNIRILFADILLTEFEEQYEIKKINSLKTLGELINSMLTAFVLEKDEDQHILRTVLQISNNAFCQVFLLKKSGQTWKKKDYGETVYLWNLLNNHGIWKGIEIWDMLLDREIKLYCKEILTKKWGPVAHAAHEQKGVISLITAPFSLVPSNLDVRYKEKVEEIKTVKNAAMTVLRKFVNYMLIFRVKSEISISLIRKYSAKNELDPKFVREFIIELKSHQDTVEPIKKALRTRIIKLHKIRFDCQQNGKLIGIYSCIKYLENPKDLLNILLLNKKYSEILKIPIYKEILIKSKFIKKDGFLIPIWKNFLNFVFFKIFIYNIGKLSI